MKKSRLAILLTMTFILAGCDDANLSQKVIETEKQFVQLQADYKKAQTDLTTKENELNALKADYTKLSAEYSELQKRSTSFPALQVEITKLIDKSETLKFPKNPKDEFAREESKVSVFANTAITHIEWLDQLLLQELLKLYLTKDESEKVNLTAVKPQDIVERFEKIYQELEKDAKEYKPFAMEESVYTQYLGQRNHIVSFTQSTYTFTGGAHGTGYTNYLNIDTNKKALITLNDVISEKNQAKLKALLWETYTSERSSEEQKPLFVEKKDFRISDNFYFSNDGIVFVYPVYELGAYAEGEIELAINYYQLNELLAPEFKQTEKDGFYTFPENQ